MEKERNIIKCPICNEEKITKIQKIESFTLYKCLTCKLEFFGPLLFEKDQYDQYYTEGYGKEIIMKLKKFSKFQILLPLHKTYKFVLKMLIKKFPKNSVIFDIGCGTGEFLWIYSNYFHTGILNSIFKKKTEVIITNLKIEKKSELNYKKILFGLTLNLFKMIILFPIILIKYIKIFNKTTNIRLLAVAEK